MSAGSRPYIYLWSFDVVAGREEEFLRAYAPDGAWVRLFARGEGYLGTLLLQDRAQLRRFVTVDRWRSAEAHDAFKRAFAAEYAQLDRQCEPLCERELSLGEYWESQS